MEEERQFGIFESITSISYADSAGWMSSSPGSGESEHGSRATLDLDSSAIPNRIPNALMIIYWASFVALGSSILAGSTSSSVQADLISSKSAFRRFAPISSRTSYAHRSFGAVSFR